MRRQETSKTRAALLFMGRTVSVIKRMQTDANGHGHEKHFASDRRLQGVILGRIFFKVHHLDALNLWNKQFNKRQTKECEKLTFLCCLQPKQCLCCSSKHRQSHRVTKGLPSSGKTITVFEFILLCCIFLFLLLLSAKMSGTGTSSKELHVFFEGKVSGGEMDLLGRQMLTKFD